MTVFVSARRGGINNRQAQNRKNPTGGKKMKQLKKDLAAVLKSLNNLTQKVKKMGTLIDKPEKVKKAKAPKTQTKPVKKAAIKKPAKEKSGETAYATLLANIDAKGTSVKDLKSKTGFDSRKISNLLYRAKKQGKIKNEKKGVYVKA